MGRVIVHLDSNPKDKAIASIIGGYEKRVRNRGISIQASNARGREDYELELTNLPGKLVLLDERGEKINSEQMANWLNSAHLDSNTTNLAVGPHDGFSQKIRNSADRIFSLSPLTLTHEMAGALLMEQLYRASEINKGSQYHRK